LIIFQWQSDTSVHDNLPFILYVLAIHGPFSIATVAGKRIILYINFTITIVVHLLLIQIAFRKNNAKLLIMLMS